MHRWCLVILLCLFSLRAWSAQQGDLQGQGEGPNAPIKPVPQQPLPTYAPLPVPQSVPISPNMPPAGDPNCPVPMVSTSGVQGGPTAPLPHGNPPPVVNMGIQGGPSAPLPKGTIPNICLVNQGVQGGPSAPPKPGSVANPLYKAPNHLPSHGQRAQGQASMGGNGYGGGMLPDPNAPQYHGGKHPMPFAPYAQPQPKDPGAKERKSGGSATPYVVAGVVGGAVAVVGEEKVVSTVVTGGEKIKEGVEEVAAVTVTETTSCCDGLGALCCLGCSKSGRPKDDRGDGSSGGGGGTCGKGCAKVGTCAASCLGCGGDTVGAMGAAAVGEAEQKEAPPKPYINAATRENKGLPASLMGFRYLPGEEVSAGDFKHHNHPFSDDMVNTLHFSGEEGRQPSDLTTEGLKAMRQRVGALVLEFPMDLERLHDLGKGSSDHRLPYTLHIHGTLTKKDLKHLRRMLEAWSEGGFVECHHLDFAVHGVSAGDIVSALDGFVNTSSCAHLKSLSIRFAHMDDGDVKALHKKVKGRVPELERLVLTSNAIGKLGGLRNILKAVEDIPALTTLDVRGNALSSGLKWKKLGEAVDGRGTGFRIHLGFNGLDAAEVKAQHAKLGEQATFEGGGFTTDDATRMRCAFQGKVDEEDPFNARWALWRPELRTILAFGAEPFITLDLSHSQLSLMAIEYILRHVRGGRDRLRRVFLRGAFGMDGDDHSGIVTQLRRFNLIALDLGWYPGAFPMGTYTPAIKTFSNLEYLGLAGGRLKESIGDLRTALSYVRKLVFLDLRGNGFEDENLPYLMDTVGEDLTALKMFDMSGNAFQLQGKAGERVRGLVGLLPPVEGGGGGGGGGVVVEDARATSLQFMRLLGNPVPPGFIGSLQGQTHRPTLVIDELHEGGRSPVYEVGLSPAYRDLGGLMYDHLSLPNYLLDALTVVELSMRGINAHKVDILMRCLELGNPKVLNLSDNPLGSGGGAHVGAFLERHQHVAELKLNRTNLGEKGLEALAPGVAALSGLRVLELEGNHMQEDGFEALAVALKGRQSLGTLKVGHNKLGNGGAKVLGELLPHIPYVRVLQVRGNDIGSGIEALSKGLLEMLKVEGSRGLHFLDLADNAIGGSREEFGDALKAHKNLERLWIGFNGLHGHVGPIFGNLPPSLTDLRVQGNSLDAEEAGELGTAVGNLPLLRNLNAGSQGWGQSGIAFFLQALNSQAPQFMALRDDPAKDKGCWPF